MGNTISQPITYGPHITKNPVTERVILFLEDPENDSKPLPSDLFQEDDIAEIKDKGRRGYAEYLRFLLLGGGVAVS